MSTTQLGKRRWDGLKDVSDPVKKIRSIVQHFSNKDGAITKSDEQLADDGLVQFMELKAANVSVQRNAQKSQASTAQQLERVDEKSMELSSLEYEKNNYLQQIRVCRSLEGAHQSIELVPEDTFFKVAPAELTQVDRKDGHKVMLNRLAYELRERKRLCEELTLLKNRKSKMRASNEAKQSFVGGFLSKLRALEEPTAPIQKNLVVHEATSKATARDLELLSRPLYIVHEHAAAFRSAFDSTVTVGIEGDRAAAAALCTGDEAEGKPAAVADKYDATHPLSVVVEVPCGKAKIELRFRLMTCLNVITVESSGANVLALVNLFENDSGTHSPNWANARWLPSQSTEWDPKLPGRPYKWAQWLGGLIFLQEPMATASSSSSSIIPQETFSSVVGRLRERLAK